MMFLGITAKAQTNVFPADGNVGIGTNTPIEKLDIRGNIYLRNMTNLVGGGTSLNFSSYDDVHLGPKIYSYLDYANGTSSVSRLILSSYYGGQKNEITLVGGKVGINTQNPIEDLDVNGNVRAKELIAETANWPDYVFEKNYKLPSLSQIETFINTNKHLPNIPSAQEIEAQGQNLGKINSKLVKTVEELTLHLIEKEKQINEQVVRLSLIEKSAKQQQIILNKIMRKIAKQ